MNKLLICVLGLGLAWGCARVRMEAPKEPIKLDVTMRVDVYQHVVKDINDIEDAVSGSTSKKWPGNQSLMDLIISKAYADEGLGPEVEAAIEGRKARRPQLISLEAKGVIGENRSGLVEVRMSDPAAQELMQAENDDRMVIYNAIARKNGSTLEDVQKLYAQRLQGDAVAGTPIEEDIGWKIK